MATRWLKNFDDTFIRFDRIHEPDGHTDIRTDIGRACIASRGKNARLENAGTAGHRKPEMWHACSVARLITDESKRLQIEHSMQLARKK